MKILNKSKNPLIFLSAIPSLPSVIPAKAGIQRKKCHLPACGNRESGQMMMLMVIVIAATTLAAVVFSSFMVILSLRHVTDARATGAALFAADTGIECILLKEFGDPLHYEDSGCPSICVQEGCMTNEASLFSNGPRFQLRFISRRPSPDGSREIVIWEAIGRDAAGRAVRSLQITLEQLI